MFRTLIVEDEAVNRKGLIATFDWIGAECVIVGEAQSGTEGLEKIRELKPDLVIADICMYDMDGLEMIRQGKQYCDFHSIVLTGYSEFEFARRAVALHVHAYLLKPVDRGELMNAILSIRRADSPRDAESENYPLIRSFDVIDKSSISSHVRFTLDQIKEHYTQRLQLDGIARKLYVSKSFLSKKLRDETNHTFTELLYQYRIYKALELLNTGLYRFNEIASMTGFHDYKHFSAVFRKYMQQTPSDYLNSRERIIFR